MVDEFELFDLVYFVDFFMAFVETGLSSHKERFLTMSAFRFSALDQGLAWLDGAGDRPKLPAHSGGVPSAGRRPWHTQPARVGYGSSQVRSRGCVLLV